MNETEVKPRRRAGENGLSLESEPTPKRGTREGILSKVQKVLSDKIQKAVSTKGTARVAIFTHKSPDPDAIGSQMGLTWLLQKAYENVEVVSFYDGHISHPQNQRMVNLLDPDLRPVTECNLSEFDLFISVDCVPANSVCPEATCYDLVIDHHKEIPNGGFKGIFLNLKAGSCCSTIYQLIKQYKFSFEEDNDLDSKVVTALLVGIITDTESLLSDDTTEIEHSTYAELFNFRNSSALKQIIKYKQPKEWVQARACVANAYNNVKESVLVHGIGFLDSNDRDLIAALSDEILSWEGVEVAIVFAIIGGNRIAGSVRSSNASIAVPTFCKELGHQFGGEGGGKLGKGAYSYPLGGCANQDGEMDETTKDKLWEFILERETKRLLKHLRVSSDH